METKIFNRIRDIVYEKSGIALGECKEALVSARVGKRMRSLGIDDFNNYLTFLDNDASGQEYIYMIDAISTNVTSFFRESKHFDFLRDKVQKWMEEGQKKFRFWSAACSSGEEPYSMAVTLCETLNAAIDWKILATDISTRVLKKSMDGQYSREKIKGVPAQLLEKYFHKKNIDSEIFYSVSDALKKHITFSRINLSKPPFAMSGPFDVIFCRNVMIYFDNTVRKNFLDEAVRLLRPGGYLMVGHAESLTGLITNKLKSVMPSIYIKS